LGFARDCHITTICCTLAHYCHVRGGCCTRYSCCSFYCAVLALIGTVSVRNSLGKVEHLLDKIAGAETSLDVEAYWDEFISQLSELSGCPKVSMRYFIFNTETRSEH